MVVSKFRKKPVVIEAVQVRAADFNGETFDRSPFSDDPEWLIDALKKQMITIHHSDRDYALWRINTLEDGPNGEAKHIAEPGDWIIKGVHGELYPCKPDIFEKTYDPMPDESSQSARGDMLQRYKDAVKAINRSTDADIERALRNNTALKGGA